MSEPRACASGVCTGNASHVAAVSSCGGAWCCMQVEGLLWDDGDGHCKCSSVQRLESLIQVAQAELRTCRVCPNKRATMTSMCGPPLSHVPHWPLFISIARKGITGAPSAQRQWLALYIQGCSMLHVDVTASWLACPALYSVADSTFRAKVTAAQLDRYSSAQSVPIGLVDAP